MITRTSNTDSSLRSSLLHRGPEGKNHLGLPGGRATLKSIPLFFIVHIHAGRYPRLRENDFGRSSSRSVVFVHQVVQFTGVNIRWVQLVGRIDLAPSVVIRSGHPMPQR